MGSQQRDREKPPCVQNNSIIAKKVWQTAILGMDSLFCSYWVAIQKKQGWCHARNGNGFIYLSAQFLIHGLGPLLDLINCRATHQIVFCVVTKQKKKSVRGIRIFWNFYFSGYFFISWLLFQLDLGISYYFFFMIWLLWLLFHMLATLTTFSLVGSFGYFSLVGYFG